MKFTGLLLLITLMAQSSFSQKSPSPYEWDWTRDGIWTGAAFAGTFGGLKIISNKEGFSETELADMRANVDGINFIDRWAAGNYSESANAISDIPFFISFATPVVLLFDDEVNDHTAQVLGLYIESLATTSALFTITAGLTNRGRPYTYGTDAPLNRRMSITATRSFYSGHVAATATASFFAAKVYQDFNPDSPAIPYVWAGAAALPAVVGYFRIQAGQHFPTDALLGYGLGALTGYFIPELHKKKDSSVSLQPVSGFDLQGHNFGSSQKVVCELK